MHASLSAAIINTFPTGILCASYMPHWSTFQLLVIVLTSACGTFGVESDATTVATAVAAASDVGAGVSAAIAAGFSPAATSATVLAATILAASVASAVAAAFTVVAVRIVVLPKYHMTLYNLCSIW